MKLYKKFTNYLLTHQPLLWHSMGIQLFIAMLLLNVLFYFLGYSFLDLKTLRESYDISGLFYRETFSLFWVISGLIILVVWGAYFYRHNAAKNFYPISRWYFHKMALLIFIPLLMFFWTPFSFHKGITTKAKTIIELEKLNTLIESYLETYPFILSSNTDYSYDQRNFPEAFLGVQYYDKSNDDSYVVQYYFEGKEQKLNTILKKVKAKPILNSVYAYRTVVEEHYKKVKEDSCLTYFEIFSEALDSSDLPDFERASVKNFNYDQFMNYMMPFNGGPSFLDMESDIVSDSLKVKMAKRIYTHQHEILTLLKNLKALLDEYDIQNTIDPEKNYNYLIKNDFRYSRDITISVYEDYGYYEENLEEAPYVDIYSEDTLEVEAREYYQDEDYFTQTLSLYSLENLINNSSSAHNSSFFYSDDEFYILLYFALGFTMLLLFFEWGNILSFVISIPVGGGLLIVGVLMNLLVAKIFFSSTDYSYNKIEHLMGPATFIILAGIVLFLALRSVKKSMNVYASNVAITISYFVFPLWIIILIVFLNIATSQNIYDVCLGWYEKTNLFNLRNFWVDKTMRWSPFVLFSLSLFLIKRVLAKKE
jgi:hypothetical protein